MANNDWNPDDLLDFQYDSRVPNDSDGSSEFELFDELIESAKRPPASAEKQQAGAAQQSRTGSGQPQRRGLGDTFTSYDELKRYEELRRQSREERAGVSGSSSAVPSGRSASASSASSGRSAAVSSAPSSRSASAQTPSSYASYSSAQSTAGQRASSQTPSSYASAQSAAGQRASSQGQSAAGSRVQPSGQPQSGSAVQPGSGSSSPAFHIEEPLSARAGSFKWDRRSESGSSASDSPEDDYIFAEYDRLHGTGGSSQNRNAAVAGGAGSSAQNRSAVQQGTGSAQNRSAVQQGAGSAQNRNAAMAGGADGFAQTRGAGSSAQNRSAVQQGAGSAQNRSAAMAGGADGFAQTGGTGSSAQSVGSDQADRFIFGQSVGRGLVEEVEEPSAIRSSEEIAALRQASQEAYDRYRSNYTKNKKKKKTGKTRVSKFHKWLTAIYVAALAAFVGSMTYMNVLPTSLLIVMYIVLALLSILIFVQIRKDSIKKWGKAFATFMAIILVVVYGTGTAYALGTLSFLNKTSVDNEKSVAAITRDPFNVVITGIDVSGTIDEEGRSDVNMILTVNPSTAQLLMTSIPRDYEIYMPDKDNAMDKLTHTGFYGVQSTILAEENLLDITANYYVKVNFTTVEKFIDAIGGVDVYSEYEFTPVKMKDWTVQEGMNHMNGAQALAFARERKAFITGDNQRIKNQQAVFEAMFKKATSSRTMIFSYNKILNNLQDYFEMSFSSREIRSLAKMQLAFFPDWHTYKNTITGGDDTLDTYSAGYAYVMTQDEESIEHAKTLINAVLNGQELMTDSEGVVSVAGSESETEDAE